MKNGNFIGKFTRRMTTEEMEQFVSILESAFYDAKIKIKSIESKVDQSPVSYYGFSSTEFKVILPKKIAFKKGVDTIYDLSTVIFSVQPELGFDTYENCQKYGKEVGEKGYGQDDFNSFEWSIHIRTDGRHHTYRHRYEHDYVYEGKDHYHYYTELNEFQPAFVEYLRNNIPPTSTWK